jgi:hypothetical protein
MGITSNLGFSQWVLIVTIFIQSASQSPVSIALGENRAIFVTFVIDIFLDQEDNLHTDSQV